MTSDIPSSQAIGIPATLSFFLHNPIKLYRTVSLVAMNTQKMVQFRSHDSDTVSIKPCLFRCSYLGLYTFLSSFSRISSWNIVSMLVFSLADTYRYFTSKCFDRYSAVLVGT